MLAPLVLLTALTASWQANDDFSAGQRVIKLNFIANNAKGTPVTDLAPADVQLKEDGKPRQVSFFRFAGARNYTAPTIIVLDRWNERMMTMATASNELREALKALKPGDPVYLYFLDPKGNLVPIRPLPGPEDLRDDPATVSRRMMSGLDRALHDLQGFRGPDAWDPIYRANITFRDLTALGQQMATVAGRKNLIWITHGIPETVQIENGTWFDMTPQLRALAAACLQGQVAIYPIDESSLGAGEDMGGPAHVGLQLLASLTGGRWWSSNAASQAIPSSVIDGRSYYTIAYYSPFEDKDKKFHKIHLESKRKGLRFLAADGYNGGAPDPQAWEEAAVRAAQASPLEASEIGVTVTKISRDPSTKVVHLELRVDPADVMLDDKHRAHLSVLAMASTGATASPERLDVEIPSQGLMIKENFAPPEKSDSVRYFVYDRMLRALGSVTVKLP